jgi:hypothetical protein
MVVVVSRVRVDCGRGSEVGGDGGGGGGGGRAARGSDGSCSSGGRVRLVHGVDVSAAAAAAATEWHTACKGRNRDAEEVDMQ